MEYPYKLSIITINLNNKEGLLKTIESVVNQTCQDFEWIIIDGGSSDGSKELIEKYSDQINYWVSEPDKGIYNAMNKGILVSNGEYILFLNSGDYLYSRNILSNVLCVLKSKDIYIGDIQTYKGKLAVNITTYDEFCYYLFNVTIPHQAYFIKRKCFKLYGLYDISYKVISDWIFLVKNCVLQNNIKFEKIPYIISYFEPGGISSSSDLCHSEKNQFLSNYPNLSVLVKFYMKYTYLIKFFNSHKFLAYIFKRLFLKQ